MVWSVTITGIDTRSRRARICFPSNRRRRRRDDRGPILRASGLRLLCFARPCRYCEKYEKRRSVLTIKPAAALQRCAASAVVGSCSAFRRSYGAAENGVDRLAREEMKIRDAANFDGGARLAREKLYDSKVTQAHRPLYGVMTPIGIFGQASALPSSGPGGEKGGVLDYVFQSAPRPAFIWSASPCPNSPRLCPVTFAARFAHLVIDYAGRKTIRRIEIIEAFLGSFRKPSGFQRIAPSHRTSGLRRDENRSGSGIRRYWFPRGASDRRFLAIRHRPKTCGLPAQDVPGYPAAGAEFLDSARKFDRDQAQSIVALQHNCNHIELGRSWRQFGPPSPFHMGYERLVSFRQML